jgi:protein-tyrosine phosphatase
LVVDLTAEWERARGLGAVPHLQLPTLDGMAPEPGAFQRLVEALADDPRPTYVHCAAGHGRSAALVAALLVRRGVDEGPERALARLKALRPKVFLTRAQRRLLATVQGPGPAR